MSEPFITMNEQTERASLLCSAIDFEGDECWANEVGDVLFVLRRYVVAVSDRDHVFLFD